MQILRLLVAEGFTLPTTSAEDLTLPITSTEDLTLPTTSTQALTLPTFNTPKLFFSPATKRLSRCIQSNLSPISAVKCQNKEELKNLFENHLKKLTQCTNKSVMSLQAAVESVFKRKYARPRKEFDNLAFQSGVK